MTYRTTARVLGALFITATVAGLLAVPLWQPVIEADDPLLQASPHPSRQLSQPLQRLPAPASSPTAMRHFTISSSSRLR